MLLLMLLDIDDSRQEPTWELNEDLLLIIPIKAQFLCMSHFSCT